VVTNTRVGIAVGDLGLKVDHELRAVVERKSLDNCLSDFGAIGASQP
jgi:hypothetical protein